MKTKTLLKTLLVIGLIWALSACGGGGDDGGTVDPGTASITACFTVNRTVNFAVMTSGVPAGLVGANQYRVRPTTYSGQAAVEQTFFYPTTPPQTVMSYWGVINNGVTMIAQVGTDNTVTPDGSFLPEGMSKNQTVTSLHNINYTFLGFETFSLAGKTFSNTCHIRQGGNITGEMWVAPGYGIIKQAYPDGIISQYSGDL
jgi:hypothetical protein